MVVMKWIIALVLGLTVSGIVFSGGYFLGKKFENYRVNRVVDGDTLGVTDLRTGRDWRMRLWGIDAPEAKECGAKESKANLEKIIGGRKPSILVLGVDGFGRYIARLWVIPRELTRSRWNTRDFGVPQDPLRFEIAKTIVADGWARVDISTESVYEDLKPSLADIGELRRLEEKAKAAKLGIWGEACGGK